MTYYVKSKSSYVNPKATRPTDGLMRRAVALYLQGELSAREASIAVYGKPRAARSIQRWALRSGIERPRPTPDADALDCDQVHENLDRFLPSSYAQGRQTLPIRAARKGLQPPQGKPSRPLFRNYIETSTVEAFDAGLLGQLADIWLEIATAERWRTYLTSRKVETDGRVLPIGKWR